MTRAQLIQTLCDNSDWAPEALEAVDAFDSFAAMMAHAERDSLPTARSPQALVSAWIWFQAGWYASD